jgi:RNA polymerase sigma-70 factor, ECF subfamily
MAEAGHGKNETEALLKLVSLGNEAAAARLLNLHRRRLQKMVSLRFDQQLAARRDPSDVVHETMLAAASKLDEYIQNPRVPFYAWLRSLAWNRLVELHRQPPETSRGEGPRTDFRHGLLTPKCLSELVRRFGPPSSAKGPMPTAGDGSKSGSSAKKSVDNSDVPVSRRKARAHVEAALASLEPAARELLLLYYVEQLTVPEIASVLAIEAAQVKLRHVRAIRKLRTLLVQQGLNPAVESP